MIVKKKLLDTPPNPTLADELQKGVKFINLTTEDVRKVERIIIKVVRESLARSTVSWPLCRLNISNIDKAWLLEPEKVERGHAHGICQSYEAICDYRKTKVDENFHKYVKTQSQKGIIFFDFAGSCFL